MDDSTLLESLEGLIEEAGNILALYISQRIRYVFNWFGYLEMFQSDGCRYDCFDVVAPDELIIGSWVEISKKEGSTTACGLQNDIATLIWWVRGKEIIEHNCFSNWKSSGSKMSV